MRSLGIHAGPREYLDAQFAFESTRAAAACSAPRSSGSARTIPLSSGCGPTAARRLPRYQPESAKTRTTETGYIFGYKDMDDGMGPVEAECPEAILQLLTPTESSYALAWRTRCWAGADERRAAGRRAYRIVV